MKFINTFGSQLLLRSYRQILTELKSPSLVIKIILDFPAGLGDSTTHFQEHVGQY